MCFTALHLNASKSIASFEVRKPKHNLKSSCAALRRPQWNEHNTATNALRLNVSLRKAPVTLQSLGANGAFPDCLEKKRNLNQQTKPFVYPPLPIGL